MKTLPVETRIHFSRMHTARFGPFYSWDLWLEVGITQVYKFMLVMDIYIRSLRKLKLEIIVCDCVMYTYM